MKHIIYELIDSIVAEINQPDVKEKINTELIQPIIQHLTKQLYPYLLTTCVIVVLMFICIITTFIIILQGVLKHKSS
jgi:hypothetical protein